MEDSAKRASNSGVYVLWLFLPEETTIRIGKLGVFNFSSGVYAYAGSAQRNLRQRVSRHQRLCKKMHWHIDYLRDKCRYLGQAVLLASPKEMECKLVQDLLRIPTASYAIPGFGSSDCRCFSHLIHVPLGRPRIN